MKICWDNLEGLRYSKRTGKWYSECNSTWIYKESCKVCKEPFLGNEHSIYCSKFCLSLRIVSKETKDKQSESHKGNKLTKEHSINISKSLKEKYSKCSHHMNGKKLPNAVKEKIGKSNSGKNSHLWKGGYHKKGIPLYDTYAPQLEWCEEVRRSPIDENILEVRCVYCGRWYIPKLWNVINRIQIIKGNTINEGEGRFYCSDGCKKSCPIFNQRKWPKEFKIDTSREVQPELRKLVLERDEYQCVKCGSKKLLHCHHITGVEINPIESADVDNCVTFCKQCHNKIHKQKECNMKRKEC